MTGRTNASAGGYKKELVWTNPTPNENFGGTLTLNLSGYVAYIICAKAYANHTENTEFLQNFVEVGQSIVFAGYSRNTVSSDRRLATATATQLLITDDPYSNPNQNIPLFIYGIK